MQTITFSGNNLRKFRVDAELSRAALAVQIGSSEQSIARWEQGRGEPSATRLLQAAAVLGVTAEALANTAP